MYRSILFVAVTLLLCAPVGASVQGPLYFATAGMGAPNQNGGLSISTDQWPGARFVVSSTVTIDSVGGHIGRLSFNPNPLFAAVVKLSSDGDYPDSDDLSTPDVLAHSLFTPGSSSSDVIAAITPLTLAAGDYAVIFGTGEFGATGEGFMPTNNSVIGSPTMFEHHPSSWADFGVGDPTERFAVYQAIPEPTTALAALPAALALLRKRRTSNLRNIAP